MDSAKTPERKRNPRATSNFLTSVFFLYVIPVFYGAYKKEFTSKDLYEPLKEDRSNWLLDTFETNWKRANITNKKYSLHIALFKTYYGTIIITGCLILTKEIARIICVPYSIGKLVVYFSQTTEEITITHLQAYLYAAILIASLLFERMISHPVLFWLNHMSLKMRVACSGLIYRKVFQFNKSSLHNVTIGHIVNLLTNDIGRIDHGFHFFHFVWIAPIETVIAITYLYMKIGAACFMGVGFLLILLPLQMLAARKIAKYRFKTAISTDARVKLMNEIISGVQLIKMYTWETPFSKLTEVARKKEINFIRKQKLIWAVVHFEMYATRVAIFVSLVSFYLMGEEITTEIVFNLVALFDVINHTIASLFEAAVRSSAELNISLLRMNTFLNLKDSNKLTSSQDLYSDTKQTKPFVSLKNITAKWFSENSDDTLKDISLNITQPQLFAIIGPVGSGKSSLIHIMLKELPIATGDLVINGQVSYYSQEPWIFAASIRQNILFGDKYDETRYKKVCNVCALNTDFKMFIHGDQTLVGESGKALSGGQKARIALARCVYKQADIYLLDDPLSAVDIAVGRQLFYECIKTFLKDKICVLITHQLQFLQEADQILIMNHGRNEGIGTYTELQNSGLDFAQLLGELSAKEVKNSTVTKEKPDKQLEMSKTIKPSERLEKEVLKTGAVTHSTYSKYMRAGGNYFVLSYVCLLFVLYQVSTRGANYFLTYWVNTEEFFAKNAIDLETEDSVRRMIIYEYGLVLVATIVFAIYHKVYFFVVMMRSSANLHNDIFRQLLNAKMHFFNTTPMGRILNRFSKDLGIVDEHLPTVLYQLMSVCMNLLGIIVLTSIVKPWLLGPAVILVFLFYGMRCFYIRASRSIKRIEGINRSPVLNQVTASFTGLTTIRAFGLEKLLVREFQRYQDEHTAAYWLFMAATRAFGMWLDLSVLVFITLVIIVLLSVNTDLRGGDMGLIITQYMGLMASIQFGMRQWSELETNMTSVERVLEYTELDNEPQRENKQILPKNWPNNGKLQFKNITMQYLQNEPPVLKNINFVVQPGEKIGIVGRTGAGKSSIITALFQLYLTDGVILIDDVDVTKIPLYDLRSKISIIPQEPILFEGTMRKNLDPFDQFQDDILWNALEQVKLKDLVSNMTLGLQSNITEGGANFSVGQRQLLCLARAIIRKNKIFVLDEATANVDPYTDELIQNTIRVVFKDCTVLTIAHRLHTVMDSDKILVMDAGEVVEYDAPFVLLQNTEGKFSSMVEKTGSTSSSELRNIAEKAYQQQHKLNK